MCGGARVEGGICERVAGLRAVLVRTVTDEDMAGLARKLIDLGREGNVSAAKLVLTYTLGRPGAAADLVKDTDRVSAGNAKAQTTGGGVKVPTTTEINLGDIFAVDREPELLNSLGGLAGRLGGRK